MQRKLLGPLLIILFCFVLIEIDGGLAEAATLKFATPFSPRHTMQVQVFEPWGKKIEQLTHGKIQIKMFPGGALGKTPAHYSLAEQGIADIAYTLHDYTPGRFPATEVFSLPFMTPTAEKASVAMWKLFEQSADFRKEYSKVKVLALFCHPGGDFHTFKKEISCLDDFRGLKFRTASPYVTEALKIFGAAPISMPVTETYSALEREVVDGTVVPWEGLGIFKLDNLTHFALEADFYTMPMMVVMNKGTWESLPDDVQKIIDRTTGLVMSQQAGRVYDNTDEPFRKQALRKGIKVNTLSANDLNALKQLTKPMRAEWSLKARLNGLDADSILIKALQWLGIK